MKMNAKERSALRLCTSSIIEDLGPKDVVHVLFRDGNIDIEVFEEILELNETRRAKCRRLMRYLIDPQCKCSFNGLISAFTHDGAYSFLAKQLKESLTKVQAQEELPVPQYPHVECLNDLSDNNIPTRTVEPKDRRRDEDCANYLNVEPSTDDQNPGNSVGQTAHIESPTPLFQNIRRINVYTAKRRKLAALSVKLKRLSHDGQYDAFQKVVSAINTSYRRNKLSLMKLIGDRMGLADMRFASLEAEVSARRVRFEETDGSTTFRDMEAVIPFTTDPRLSSMTYLARYGSSIAMDTGNAQRLDDGLAYLQFAKEHAEYVSPCKDTGMVYYIESNLLLQKYEKQPTDQLKNTVLETIEKGISQFNEECDEIRRDYQRQLMLKMAYCYLGLGLFGKRIVEGQTSASDKDAARKVMEFIESGEVWEGMEKRRKMLFYHAKAEYYRQLNNVDIARVHAKEAEKLARENKWTKELPNISNLLDQLDKYNDVDIRNKDLEAVENILAEYLPDCFNESQDESIGNNELV
ncbi:hypothetical protein MAR_022173 [Mya arenaria]|uniref:CARD domain-containing protein n=1 Tax=Mya arenaria TaxID=6604 RepID=A0ABY7DM88_MYAAR|nr:uncharacterized protein LOC128229126 [Mya arenaria]WAQ97800.1 hypothetical protein MAR_022173 [Mya arenaria]